VVELSEETAHRLLVRSDMQMRPTTSCQSTLFGILYGSFQNKAMDHRVVNDPIAKALMEDVHEIVALP
jgi:O-methyltransferase involved in polyketide biosynthesis